MTQKHTGTYTFSKTKKEENKKKKLNTEKKETMTDGQEFSLLD